MANTPTQKASPKLLILTFVGLAFWGGSFRILYRILKEFDTAEVLEDSVEDGEHADPEGEPHEGQDEQLGRAPAGALFADPLQGGPPLGLEHPPERGLRHAARPPSLSPPP